MCRSDNLTGPSNFISSNRKSNNYDLYAEDENDMNDKFSSVDPSRTYNLKSIKSFKKEPKLGHVVIDKINLPQQKGATTHRVIKEMKSDNEKSTLSAQKSSKMIPDSSIKLNIDKKRKNSVSKVNLVYASEPEKGKKLTSPILPDIQPIAK